MGETTYSKSLIQFSVDGWDCVPSLLFPWGQTMVEVMKIMVTSFKRSSSCTAPLKCPQPCSRPPLTHISARDSWTLTGKSRSVSYVGHCSFLLGPGAHKFLFVPPRVCFPDCVSSGGSMVGLMATSSKRAYAIPKSAAPRAPDLDLHRRCSQFSVSVGSLGPGVHKVCLSPLSVSGEYGVWF